MTDKLEKMREGGWRPVNEVEHFPDHIKEWAAQLWMYRCARDSKRVSAYMRAGEGDGTNEEFPPTVVSPRTIRKWAQTYNWSERQLKEQRALHSDQFNSVQIQNINNSVDAIRVQAEVLQMVKADVEAKASWRPDPEQKRNEPPKLRLDARELKAIADFTNGILDRAGHLPYTRKDTNDQPMAPTGTDTHGIGAKPMEELIALSSLRISEWITKGAEEAVIDVEPTP